MATATEQRPASNGSLNGNGNGNGNGIGKYMAHRVAEDNDSIATEQFPEFDPSHDGSEDEVHGGEHYTHTAAEQRNGAVSAHTNDGAVTNGGNSAPSPNHNDEGGEEHEVAHGRLSPVEPVPEPAHAHRDEPEPPRADPPTMTSPITSPPYWRHSYANGTHGASLSSHAHNGNLSTESLVPGGITLQDNEADDDDDVAERRGGGGGGNGNGNGNGNDGHGHHARARGSEETRTSYGRDRNKACWAKSVEVTDFVTVNGSATNIGAFVVWNIRVQTLSGPYMNIRKRYSEFDDFRHDLIRTFPNFEAAVPVLPPKSVISRFRPRFLEKRRAGLQYFLNCILLNPEFSGSPVLKDFLFS